jgi:hypothetical protein
MKYIASERRLSSWPDNNSKTSKKLSKIKFKVKSILYYLIRHRSNQTTIQ